MTRSLRIPALVLVLLILVYSAAVQPSLVRADSSAWTGEYYNNTDLSGTPALTRSDSSIDFFWPEYTSPAPGWVNTSYYSVRWTRSVYFNASGTWYFNTTNDDGMRVWVDDAITMDAWYDQGPSDHEGNIYLNTGWHTVKVEYYNRVMGGTARLTYSLDAGASEWKGEFYANLNLEGSPAHIRTDPAISFNWGTISPAPGIPADHFSVRWTRTQLFSGGTWRFTTTTDDGVRLWVDGTLLIDRWYDQSESTYAADIALAAGTHTIRMEYYDNHMNAVARLSYSPSAPAAGGVWRGQYYDNPDLDGTPVLVRDDASLHFNWATASPGPGVPVDYFSAKWDSYQILPSTGNYDIVVSADDGIRVWIDNALVIDRWYDHSAQLFTASRWLAAGGHNFHVEYYDRSVNAMVGFDITPAAAPVVAAPARPLVEVTVDNQGPGWKAGGAATNWNTLWSGVGGHTYWTYNNASAEAYYSWARWYPSLPQAHNYEVFAYIPANASSTSNARYWVYHNGSYASAPRSQVASSDEWLSLGTFYFNAQGGEYVSLSDVTDECDHCRAVVFDAVKFSPR